MNTGSARFRMAATLARVVPGVRLRAPDGDGDGADVDLEVVVEGGWLHPAGIVRAPMRDREVHVFATTLPTATCASLLADRGRADDVVHLWHDDATDVTLVHVENPPCRRGRDAAMDVLLDALAACVAEELIRA